MRLLSSSISARSARAIASARAAAFSDAIAADDEPPRVRVSSSAAPRPLAEADDVAADDPGGGAPAARPGQPPASVHFALCADAGGGGGGAPAAAAAIAAAACDPDAEGGGFLDVRFAEVGFLAEIGFLDAFPALGSFGDGRPSSDPAPRRSRSRSRRAARFSSLSRRRRASSAAPSYVAEGIAGAGANAASAMEPRRGDRSSPSSAKGDAGCSRDVASDDGIADWGAGVASSGPNQPENQLELPFEVSSAGGGGGGAGGGGGGGADGGGAGGGGGGAGGADVGT